MRTPEALLALERWVGAIDERTRNRGRVYQQTGLVLAVWAAADHYIEAEVAGGEVYNVTLFLNRGAWRSACSCPVGLDCKHAVATALAWIDTKGADFDKTAAAAGTVALEKAEPSAAPAPRPQPKAAVTKAIKPSAFRDQWAPVLSAKLGRPLTPEESRQLSQLAALFVEVRQANGFVYEQMLRRHGFSAAIPPGTTMWEAPFRNWWSPQTAPADPWAFWQYLAYSMELRGEPIPEFLRPLTDTRVVHAALDEHFTREQLDVWRRALTVTEASSTTRAERLSDLGNVRARITAEAGVVLEVRPAPDKPWRSPFARWATALGHVRPASLEGFSPGEVALVLTLILGHRYGHSVQMLRSALPPEMLSALFASSAAHGAIVLPDERPFAIEPEPLVPEAVVSANAADRMEVRLVTPDGSPAVGVRLIVDGPTPLYLFENRVWRGPPPLPKTPLPTAVLADAPLFTRLRRVGLRLPASIESKRRVVPLRPVLWVELIDDENSYTPHQFRARLYAESDEPPGQQHWTGVGGWQWTARGAPPPRSPDDPIIDFDLAAAQAVSARFPDFRLVWSDWQKGWIRPAGKTFADDFLAWHATLPAGLAIEASPELAGLFQAPLRASVDFSATPTEPGRDWFDLTVAVRVEDTTLTADEIALLLKARGKWVRLPKSGWRRLALDDVSGGDPAAALERLGLTADDVMASGKPVTHRVHALQLAGEAAALEARDATLAAALRQRVATLAATPPARLPGGLTAVLRPYQEEGFQFLAHLSSQGFGGVLADDMGLGKTVQSLAWLLHLAAARREGEGSFRALVVCPKSVMHGWLTETARFAPTLRALAFDPTFNRSDPTKIDGHLLVANYPQLRLNAEWFQSASWDAVILDEGQFIKNPASQIAAVARSLPARHRLVLTGTPVENRLSDLWSLFAFAQPGLLGTLTMFRRQYDEKDPAALTRLHRRVHHFLLRRTKAQAAPDLPPRTEDDLVVELEPAQRKLYDAELKRARAQLLGIETSRELDKVRFNILASLLRLRQICCHPALVDRAHANLPSAKLDALLERVEELRDEGHQVLVFSQFVEMLMIIRTRLEAAGIPHLLLTGQTENRAELVDKFQADRSQTVFLLSLRAAGFGLNLTAASYAILYDPWWNPAVEAQAIDRTHRIGQTRAVIAYRLLARDTVEEKIRQLQQEKAALAAAVVQEESLASVLDLESLRRILA